MRVLVLLCAILIEASVNAAGISFDGLKFDSPISLGNLGAEAVTEASGITVSRFNPGVFWTHNDGSRDSIYLFQMNGTLLGTFRLRKNPQDVEDIARGPGPKANTDYLYIGDIGSNQAIRDRVRIYRVEEPLADPAWADAPVLRDFKNVESCDFVYPDGTFNAEALLLDGAGGMLYVVTKQTGTARFYRAPLASFADGQNVALEFAGQLAFTVVSGGAVSVDGSLVAIRREDYALAWLRNPGESLMDAVARPGTQIPLVGSPTEPNGEAISFLPDGSGYVTLSEGVNQPLYFFQRQILQTPPQSELFVSSHDSSQVFRFDERDFAFMDVFIPNTDGRLSAPHGLAFGPDGNLYVASAGNDRVLRYNGQTGAYIDDFVAAGSGSLDYPVALIFRGTNLFVSSQLNNRVLRYRADNGAFIDTFVMESNALAGPSDMRFGPDGNLYVVGRFNNRVVRYNGQTGAFIDSFINSNLSQPFGLRFLRDGNLLVVNGDNAAAQLFNSAGGFVRTFTSGGGLSFPIGIVLGVDEMIVASYGNDKLTRFDAVTGISKGDITAPGLSGPNFMTFRPSAQPTVALAAEGANFRVTWPEEFFGFKLMSSPTLEGPYTATTNLISATNPAGFFRLEKAY